MRASSLQVRNAQQINAHHQARHLSSALRLFVLAFYRDKASAELGDEVVNGNLARPPLAFS
jgi:hypothetical protein